MSEGVGAQTDMRNLANQWNETQTEINMIACSEFRDGFSPYSLITNKDGLLSHTLTLFSIDSTVDNRICAYPINLGHKQKKYIMTETTCMEEMNKLQDPFNPTKVHSKDCGCCTPVVLLCGFISMDQI